MDASTLQNDSVDELIDMIKEKLNNSHSYIQQMFRNNDPKGQGTISREALTRVLWNICGFLTTQQINTLLHRLKLSGQSCISFNDFKNCFQNNKVYSIEWINPSSAKYLQRSTERQKSIQSNIERTFSESSWNLLLETVKKSESLQKYLPSSCLHTYGFVTLHQFKEAVKSIDLILTNDEFDNIWTRITKGTKASVPTVILFGKLGLKFPGNNGEHAFIWQKHGRTEEVICAIKEKLNETSISLLQEFRKMNSSANGLISRSDFRLVLINFNVPMTAVDMEHLLARFNLRRKDGMVDFSAFVDKLRSRSCLSFMKKILKKAEQWPRYDDDDDDDDGANKNRSKSLTASEAEWGIFQLCQGLFIRLLMHLHEADIHENGFVNCEDFKEIIKKTLKIKLTEEQIIGFAIILESQDFSSLSYVKFLSLIQDRPTTSELKEEVARLCSAIKVHHRMDKIRYRKSFEMVLSKYTHVQTPRNIRELHSVIWNLLQNNFWNFCKVFINTCKTEDCTVDKEKLDAIFLRMNLILLPEEMNNLWPSLPVSYPVEAISLQKLLSYFCAMKNQKGSGSKKENPVEVIQAQLTKDIVKYWSEIKSLMKNRDPQGTGQVSFTEICAVFLALRLEVGPVEFDTLCQAFDLKQDGRFHYIPFLKFYIRKNRNDSLRN